MTTFTASEVVAKLRERFASGNDVPVPDVRLTRAEFDVIADRLEADDKAVPVAWVNPDDLHNPNFVGVNAVKVGHESLGKYYTLPLYTHSAQAQPPAASVPGAHWFKVRAWLTDESFGYDRWKADMYSMGKGTHDAYLLIIGDVPSLGNHLKECENPLVAQENPNG